MGDIIPYKGHELEIIKPQELITSELLKTSLPRFFLVGGIHVGKYNQAGFVVVDRVPDGRPCWIGSDIMRYHPEAIEREIEDYKKYGEGVGIPEEKRFFYDTRGGMAALRYFAISEELMDIFNRDEFLGEPLIRKICEKDVVPKDFEELPVFPPNAQSIDEYNIRIDFTDSSDLGRLVNALLIPLKERVGRNYTHFPYVTYFPTAAYSLIVPTLEESVKEVVIRFDKLGDGHRLKETYKEIKTNPLLLK